MSVIVGLSGYAGSGKDTAAEKLIELGFQRVAFADKLRDFLYELNPIVSVMSHARLRDLVDLEGWDYAKRHYPEVRALLQRCGTDAGRKVLGDDVWVNAVIDTLPSEGAFVITDVRFPNEANAIIRANGYVLRIDRPGVGPATAPDGTVHTSETALDDWGLWDGVLPNVGTVHDLHAWMDSAIRRFASVDERLEDFVPPILEPTC